MPSYAAGPRPATVRLAQTSSQCIKETLNRYLPLPSSATKPANSLAPKPQIIARNRVRPRRSRKPSRSNLHSAPHPPVSLTAVSFPGGFRTPAPVQAASSRWAVIQFFGQHSQLAERAAFIALLAPLRKIKWYVYGKRPFAGPEAVLAYLARYTHRVAIANSRLIAFDKNTVSFKYKDYRLEGPDRYKVMTLATDEFIRRFLIHVLPKGLHRIRHYGLFAKSSCADNIIRARELLAVAKPDGQPAASDVDPSKPACPCCGGRMIVIEVFERGTTPRHRPTGSTIVI